MLRCCRHLLCSLDAYVSATPIIPNLHEPLPSFTILVVGVTDTHEKTTNIESAWWILFNGDKSEFSLIPVYPVVGFDNLAQYQAPHDPIAISTKDMENFEKVEVISSQNLAWDHILVIDQASLNSIIAATGNEATENSTAGMFEGAPKTWQDPDSALDFQTGILQFLCSHKASFSQPQKAETVIDLFGGQIKSDLDAEEVLSFWTKLNHNGFEFTCEFPGQE